MVAWIFTCLAYHWSIALEKIYCIQIWHFGKPKLQNHILLFYQYSYADFIIALQVKTQASTEYNPNTKGRQLTH